MKKIITYGTFDLMHYGHIRILERAKALGDYLIVGVTTDNYDKERGKLNVRDSLMKRIENVKKTGLADEVIIEEYEGQKIHDIQKYNIDTFVIGSDWLGKFDYLKEYCEVVYLERTRGISSTQIRNSEGNIKKMGIIGSGRIANRFIRESKYISGLNIEGVYNPRKDAAKEFAEKHELSFFSTDIEEFLQKVDLVYIASPHLTHIEYIKLALNNGKHVLCEKPISLNKKDLLEVQEIAKNKNLVLMEAIKTAYSPAFLHLVALAKSGCIGQIKDVEASFTKLLEGDLRELKKEQAGGSINELASYPLLAIIKLLGTDFKNVNFYSYKNEEVDLFTRGIVQYNKAIASFKVGLGVKTEGELIISGTKGYIYVPSPWWKTEYFEVRFEDMTKNKKYFYKFDEDGLRYEISEFLRLVLEEKNETNALNYLESLAIADIIESYHDKNINVI